MNITFDEITRIRGLLSAKPPESVDHCNDDCEHIECGYVVACERYTATQAQLATLMSPLLDALEHTMREREEVTRQLQVAQDQEQQTAATLDGFVGDLKKAHDAQVPLELKCPQCDLIHVDQDEWATTRLHRKHLCHGCGHLWTPYPVTTVGVDVHAPCRARRDELLALVDKVSRETPYPADLDECKSARAALIAEVGTLKARIIELEGRREG